MRFADGRNRLAENDATKKNAAKNRCPSDARTAPLGGTFFQVGCTVARFPAYVTYVRT